MKKVETFQITGMTLAGFKSYQEPVELTFGDPTVITGGNGRGKTSIADAIAFAVTGTPFFGERGIDKLHNEVNTNVFVSLRFTDETGTHELTRTRKKNRMMITYDGYEIRQLDLTDMFGERDVFLSIFNPLYFIEELGDDGKNLLERYLPMIPHEAVLAQLSEPVRESLRDKEILSPETYLTNKRAEIRELENHIIYLNGQRDLTISQGHERKQTIQELTGNLDTMRSELAALEEKQFAGMDISVLQGELVDLSARYGENNRDDQTEARQRRSAIQALREKVAQRQAEPYVSPYTKAVAEIGAAIKELGGRYAQERKAYEMLVAGAVCPTCHRKITEESLPEVQGELKKVVGALLVSGREKQDELKQLQELDEKSRDTFEQFKTDDIQNWSAEIAELEEQNRQAEQDAEGQAQKLRLKIQELDTELTYGQLTQEEYDRMQELREAVKKAETELSTLHGIAGEEDSSFAAQIGQDEQEITRLKKHMTDVIAYVSKRAELTFSQMKMNCVEISLYDVVKSTGEAKDHFKFTYKGRRYDRLSLSEKVRAGMELSELIKRLTGRNYPVFVDNMESIDDLANVRPTGQVIMAKCVRGAELQVRPVSEPVQQAA